MINYEIPQMKVRLVQDGAFFARETSVHSWEQAVSLFRGVLTDDLPHEEVWAAMLSAKNDIVSLVRVAMGGLHGAGLTPGDILRPVIASGASAFVLAHNHPSGDPKPSAADIEMTRTLHAASKVVGVLFLDHVVLGRSRSTQDYSKTATSLREFGGFDD